MTVVDWKGTGRGLDRRNDEEKQFEPEGSRAQRNSRGVEKK